MPHKDHIVFKRSFETLEKMLFSNRYGFSRPDLSILDISALNSPLSRELRRVGYQVQRLDSGKDIVEPLDLVVCDGPCAGSVDLAELVQSFNPGFQIILINQPIQRNEQSDPSYFNPATLGRFRLYSIAKWTDARHGLSTLFRMMDCPVVKIKPFL